MGVNCWHSDLFLIHGNHHYLRSFFSRVIFSLILSRLYIQFHLTFPKSEMFLTVYETKFWDNMRSYLFLTKLGISDNFWSSRPPRISVWKSNTYGEYLLYKKGNWASVCNSCCESPANLLLHCSILKKISSLPSQMSFLKEVLLKCFWKINSSNI